MTKESKNKSEVDTTVEPVGYDDTGYPICAWIGKWSECEFEPHEQIGGYITFVDCKMKLGCLTCPFGYRHRDIRYDCEKIKSGGRVECWNDSYCGAYTRAKIMPEKGKIYIADKVDEHWLSLKGDTFRWNKARFMPTLPIPMLVNKGVNTCSFCGKVNDFLMPLGPEKRDMLSGLCQIKICTPCSKDFIADINKKIFEEADNLCQLCEAEHVKPLKEPCRSCGAGSTNWKPKIKTRIIAVSLDHNSGLYRIDVDSKILLDKITEVEASHIINGLTFFRDGKIVRVGKGRPYKMGNKGRKPKRL